MNKNIIFITIIFILLLSCTHADRVTMKLFKQLKDNHIDFPQDYNVVL